MTSTANYIRTPPKYNGNYSLNESSTPQRHISEDILDDDDAYYDQYYANRRLYTDMDSPSASLSSSYNYYHQNQKRSISDKNKILHGNPQFLISPSTVTNTKQLGNNNIIMPNQIKHEKSSQYKPHYTNNVLKTKNNENYPLLIGMTLVNNNNIGFESGKENVVDGDERNNDDYDKRSLNIKEINVFVPCIADRANMRIKKKPIICSPIKTAKHPRNANGLKEARKSSLNFKNQQKELKRKIEEFSLMYCHIDSTMDTEQNMLIDSNSWMKKIRDKQNNKKRVDNMINSSKCDNENLYSIPYLLSDPKYSHLIQSNISQKSGREYQYSKSSQNSRTVSTRKSEKLSSNEFSDNRVFPMMVDRLDERENGDCGDSTFRMCLPSFGLPIENDIINDSCFKSLGIGLKQQEKNNVKSPVKTNLKNASIEPNIASNEIGRSVPHFPKKPSLVLQLSTNHQEEEENRGRICKTQYDSCEKLMSPSFGTKSVVFVTDPNEGAFHSIDNEPIVHLPNK